MPVLFSPVNYRPALAKPVAHDPIWESSIIGLLSMKLAEDTESGDIAMK
jgi:hypothetical protein